MDTPNIDKSGGNITVHFQSLPFGKHTLGDLGLEESDLKIDGGNLRLEFAFGDLGGANVYKAPTFVITYDERIGESQWQCELNGELLMDKTDGSGSTTIMTLNRKECQGAMADGSNSLVLRADLPEVVTLSATKSTFHFLETPGS